jgi:hypothetical protein
VDTDLTQYSGKKVIVQVKLDAPNEKGETLVEVEGKAEAANELGILLKPKGRTQVELIEASNIESVEFAPEQDKKLTAKTVAVIEHGKARQHLLDRHGLTLEDVNKLTEAQALEYHNNTEHEGLGHIHGEVGAKNRSEKVEQQAAVTEDAENAA